MKIKLVTEIPANSIILNNLKGSIDYVDSYQIEIENHENCSVDYLTALMFLSEPPKWIKAVAWLRDFIVNRFGLKTGLSNNLKPVDQSVQYAPGDVVGFFPVIERTENEIVLAENDKHLYFRVSLLTQKNASINTQSIYVTTVVQFHNIWGKLYFFPVKPFHKMIVKSGLSTAYGSRAPRFR